MIIINYTLENFYEIASYNIKNKCPDNPLIIISDNNIYYKHDNINILHEINGKSYNLNDIFSEFSK
jgi:hypothetical protein